MAITYRWLVNEVNSLTHMYWVNPESGDEEDMINENETEEEAVEGYIKDYRNNVIGVIWEKTAEQIYGKNGYEHVNTIDEWTIVSEETITSISNELDAKKISGEMIIAFMYFLDKEEYDIFEAIVDAYYTHENLDICKYIANNWVIGQIKTNSILYKLYYYCNQWKNFIEAIWLLLMEEWIKLDDFRKTWELDIHKEVNNFIHDIQKLILAKAWYVQMSTAFH